MAASVAQMSWTAANQLHLRAEFARLKRRFGDAGATEPDGKRTAPLIEPPPAIDQLAELFGLSSFERDVVLLAAGIEMDSALATACPGLTFGIALGALDDPHWDALTPSRPLRRFDLIRLEANRGLIEAGLRIDERILHYLAGLNDPDPRLGFLVTPAPAPCSIAEAHEAVAARAVDFMLASREPVSAVQLCGDDPHGQEDVAALVAAGVGRALFTACADDLPQPGPELEEIRTLWEREALLLPAALLVRCGADGLTPAARQLVTRLPGLVIVAGREAVELTRPILRFDVDKPRPAEQRRLWTRALGDAATGLGDALDDLCEQFRLSARTIESTGTLVRCRNGSVQSGELWNLCRAVARPSLENLAQRLTPTAKWEDLVLPELQMQTLRHLAAQVRYRLRVYESWGFSAKSRRNLGVSALFTGESGTGKTLAAEVLANELALDLYRIDLSAVVSKYIGETEKNLKKVFDAAEQGGSILLFDEADALFGKRSEVKDSHDRYANIEVSYLLQRMEAYEGLAILTTNLKTALDPAFYRRLRFTVHFPFPDVAQRELIWARSFPQNAPTRGLKLGRLAQLKMAGGSIQNIALNAAFLSAETDQPIAMKHLLIAAQLEAEKLERPLSDSETRGWT
jgi:ATPase family protein associated with various cellular activities (AAA)/winged helix domain-containing protein